MRIRKTAMAMVLVAAFVFTIPAGCKKTMDRNKSPDNMSAFAELNNSVDDSSDLPDWKGKQLTLKYWDAHGAGGGRNIKKSGGDVVSPEIKRVTGITIDEDNSFDNGSGQTFDVKLGLLSVSKDWPQLVENPQNLKILVDNHAVYDLTELLPKYCPNIMKKMPLSAKSIWSNPQINGGYEGKIYGIPAAMNEAALEQLEPNLNKEAYSIFLQPYASQGYVWVRDDILKKMYPSAKSQKEIEDLYLKNGKFSKEDILDVPINSKEDFIRFLYEIKKLGIKEDGKEVYPIHLHGGQDTWYLLSVLTGYLDGRGVQQNDYFTYYDKKSKKVEYGFKDRQFKESMKMWNTLLNDGIGSIESLIDSAQVFNEKVKNGLYAVVYPDNSELKNLNGKPYAYRKVYLNMKADETRYYEYATLPITYANISILKDAVKEEDLPQILRWMDFMVSDAGEKLVNWGPRSAGLWETKDGKRAFKDKELEDYMIYNQKSDKGLYYNLSNGYKNSETNGLRTSYMRNCRSKFAPAVVYSKVLKREEANNYFSMGFVDTPKLIESKRATFWSFITIPNVEKAWKSRKQLEDAMLKTLTASNDEQFEKLYNDCMKIANQNGYTDETLEEVDKAFKEINKEYMGNLK